jgi:hypothetical protein
MNDMILFGGAIVIVCACLGFLAWVDELFARTIRAERERERMGASLALGLFGCPRDRKD